MNALRCTCDCHAPPDGRWRSDGVDVRDPIESLTACSECSWKHRKVWDEPPSNPLPLEPPRPADAAGDSGQEVE